MRLRDGDGDGDAGGMMSPTGMRNFREGGAAEGGSLASTAGCRFGTGLGATANQWLALRRERPRCGRDCSSKDELELQG